MCANKIQYIPPPPPHLYIRTGKVCSKTSDLLKIMPSEHCLGGDRSEYSVYLDHLFFKQCGGFFEAFRNLHYLEEEKLDEGCFRSANLKM